MTAGANPTRGFVDQVIREGDDVTIKVALDLKQQTVASLLGKEALTVTEDGSFITGTIKDVTYIDSLPHLVLTDGFEGSEDVLVPFNDTNVLKVTSKVKFDEITEIGEPVDLGDLDQQQ